MVLTKKQKKELVIKLYKEGKTTREIAKIVKISLRDIGIILREYNKEPEPAPPKSLYARSLEMFSQGKTLIEVSIALDLPFETVRSYYFKYLELNYTSDFVKILTNHVNYLPFFIYVAKNMEKNDLFKEDVNILISNLHDLNRLIERKIRLQHEVNCLEGNKMTLENEITNLEEKIKEKLSFQQRRFQCLSDDM